MWFGKTIPRKAVGLRSLVAAAGLYVIWREHHIAKTNPVGSAF